MPQTFAPSRFNTLLQPTGGGLGQYVSWRKAFQCACRSKVSGAADQACPICQGRGVAWDAKAIPCWTGLTGLKVAREWAAFGQWESGDVMFTIPANSPLWNISKDDRVMMTNSSEPFSIILTRTGTERPVQPGTVVSVERVVWRNPADKSLVTGGNPRINPDGTFNFAAGVPPPQGIQYSMTGRRRIEYFMYNDIPQDRAHSGGLALPRRVAMRRLDLFARQTPNA